MKTTLITSTQVIITIILLLLKPGDQQITRFINPVNNSGLIQVQDPTAYPDPDQTFTPVPTYNPYPTIGGEEEIIVPTNTSTLPPGTQSPDLTTTPTTQLTSDTIAYPGIVDQVSPQPPITVAVTFDQSDLSVEVPESSTGLPTTSTQESEGMTTDDSRVYFYLEMIFLVFGAAAVLLGCAMIFQYFRSK